MNFYDVLAAEKWGGGIPTTNFFDLLFAQSMGGGEQWQTYEGTLPATFNANGDDMKQYRVFGNTDGVGDRTVQLFDKTATDTNNGYAVNRGLYADGSTDYVGSWNVSEYIPISANQDYVFKNLYGNTGAFCIYDSSKEYIWGEAYENRTTITFNSGANASYIRFTFRVATNMDTLMLTEGTTPPELFTPFGYAVNMATGGNILQSSEIEQGGWQAASGSVPQKIVNPKRCRSKNIYPISGEKIFYDYKSLNVNIAFIDGTDLSLGGTGFETGAGSVDVPANAVKCLFIIANTNIDDNNTLAQVIATGIWASVDATTTPIYIGDDPLNKDEYVDYQTEKVFRRTAQVMPPAPAETKTLNGVTITCDGEGRYSISGTATANAYNIRFTFPDFTIPTSIEQGGSGTFSMFNTFVNTNVLIRFLYNNTSITTWSCNALNRTSTNYSVMGGQVVNTIDFNVPSGAIIDGVISPMITDNGTLPETYIPYLQPTDPPVPLPALPTVEGETIVDYAGSGTAPEKVYFEYQGGKQP